MNAGYAQTWVIKKHFFFMGSLVGGIGINTTGLSQPVGAERLSGSGLQVNGTFRLAAGYNSSDFYAGVQFIEFTTRNIAPITNAWQEYDVGSFRVVVARRFKAKKYKLYEVYEKIMPY